jgi:hypothetical protein
MIVKEIIYDTWIELNQVVLITKVGSLIHLCVENMSILLPMHNYHGFFLCPSIKLYVTEQN